MVAVPILDHAAWCDDRDHEWIPNIYYKRNLTGNLIEEDLKLQISNEREILQVWPNPARRDIRLQICQKSDVRKSRLTRCQSAF